MDADQHRVTVQEAARRLGVTEQAIRKRIKRGTLESETEAGRVYVYLDTSYTGYEPGQDAVTNPDSPALISQMQARIDSLERQLEEANTRDRENRRIIMQQAQNLAAIEAPEAPEKSTSQNDTLKSDEEEPPADTEGSNRSPNWRSWWRRLLGRGL